MHVLGSFSDSYMYFRLDSFLTFIRVCVWYVGFVSEYNCCACGLGSSTVAGPFLNPFFFCECSFFLENLFFKLKIIT